MLGLYLPMPVCTDFVQRPQSDSHPVQLSLKILVFVHLLSKFKAMMNLLGLSFILYVLLSRSGNKIIIYLTRNLLRHTISL